MTARIPLAKPSITEAERQAVAEVMASDRLAMGPRVEALEAEFSALTGVRHAIAVSSGTAGLHLAVIAAGLGDGDAAITSPYSFVASSNCLLYERALPVFVDIDPVTLNASVDLAAEAAHDLARGGEAARRWLPPAAREGALPRLRALLPVDIFGLPVDAPAWRAVAQAHDLVVIEDACEAAGARVGEAHAGAGADAAVFGFYPNKQMTTGEGGVIVTPHDDWAQEMRVLRNQGQDWSNDWMRFDRLGFNYRLDEISAALGAAQAVRLGEMNAARDRVACWYDERLAAVEGVTLLPRTVGDARRSWFVYVVLLPHGVDRAAVIASLDAAGVDSRPYFPTIHLQPYYRRRFGYEPGAYPVTEDIAQRSLALPFFTDLQEAEVDRVVEALTEALRT